MNREMTVLWFAGTIVSDFELTAHGLDFKSSFKRLAYDSIVSDVSVSRKTGPFSLHANIDDNHQIVG
jgi:hypothetical protein